MPVSSLSSLAAWQEEIQALLPRLSRCQARVLGEMVYAMLMIDGCGRTRICSFLSHLLGKTTETLRQKYREILYEKEAKAGVKKRGCKRREILVEEHFADLLRGVLRGWEGERILALALDASTLTDRFDVLSISVLTRGGAIRVAWTMLQGHQEGAWREHWIRMLGLLQEAVPADWQVLVMADRGLYAAWLFDTIVANGWHALLRVNGTMTFCPTGSDTFGKIAEVVCEAGSAWKGSGAWSGTGERRQGTLAVQWERGYEEAIAVVSDLPPEHLQVSWYQMRFWIETEYKDGKRGWFHWEQSKMVHPQRASRLWLVLSIALQKAILLGNALEAREEAKQSRQRLERKAACGPAPGQQGASPEKRPRGREQSVLLRGMMALRAAACGAIEVLPQGHICFEPLPEQMYALSKPSKSYEEKHKHKEEHRRNRQRRRARERAVRQEARRQRHQEKQAEAEAKRAARMARREEQAAQAEARRQRQREKQAFRETRPVAPRANLLAPDTKGSPGPKGRSDYDLATLAEHRRMGTFPREQPLLRLVRGRLQPPPKLLSEERSDALASGP